MAHRTKWIATRYATHAVDNDLDAHGEEYELAGGIYDCAISALDVAINNEL